jgi:hypothetical protein
MSENRTYPTEGARISSETGKSVFQHVRDDYLDSLDLDPEARKELDAMLSLGASRMTNMTGGRHSDAMRSEVAAHKRLGHETYKLQWERERGIKS